jgi:hypothetical protein
MPYKFAETYQTTARDPQPTRMIASSSYSNNIQIPVIAVKHSTGIKLLTAAGYTIDDTTAVPIDDATDLFDDDTEQSTVTVIMFSGNVTADTTDTDDDDDSSSNNRGSGDKTGALNSSSILGEY